MARADLCQAENRGSSRGVPRVDCRRFDTLIFAPGFGAGAVAGYVVARVDPAIEAT